MIAKEILSKIIFPVQTSDTGNEVLAQMQFCHVRHLPIVNHEQLLGVISEEDLLIHDINEPIGTYRLNYLRPYAFENDHILEVLSKIGQLNLTLIPVIDAKENYLGIITLEELVKYFSETYSLTQMGSIIVLETAKHNYSIAEIARIAEQDDTTIMVLLTHQDPGSNRIFITLKVNKINITRFVSNLNRFGYAVVDTFANHDVEDDMKERYEGLMSYLNI